MNLTNSHREALLSALEKAQKEKALAKKCLDKHKDRNISTFFEVDIFLEDQRIELIKQSLISNEIDL